MAHPTPDALALVALGEGVESESLRHVGECRACFAEVEALQQVVSVGRSLDASEHLSYPHPRVWEHISTDLGRIPVPYAGVADAPLAAAAPPTPDRFDRRRPRRWAPAAIAAAALVVGVLGGLGAARLGDPAPAAGAATQLNALPAYPGAHGTATVEQGADGARTLVVTMAMPATADAGGSLEVWMSDSRAEDMVAIGTLAQGTTARLPLPAGMDLTTHPIVDVSLEGAGDADPAHSAVSVVRGRLRV